MSVKEFKEKLIDSVLSILWRQWASIGVYSDVEQENRFLIDPESLLCVTCFFGRFDQRLFDEVLSWLGEYGHLLNIDRLKNVLRLFNMMEKQICGAASEYLVEKEQKRKWEKLFHFCEKNRQEHDMEDFFMDRSMTPLPTVGEVDKIFSRWGFRRDAFDLRRRIQNMDFEKPSNLLFKLRSFFGVNARADISAFLLYSEGDNSLQISQKISFNQRNVYRILNDLYESGLVEKKNMGKRSLYTIDHDSWSSFFQATLDVSYIIWARVFSAFSFLCKSMYYQPDKFEDPYLAASEFKEISERFIPDIEVSGLVVPTKSLKNRLGESYTPHFIDYVEKILDKLMASNK